MFEIVDKSQKPFPLERAILLSIVAHVLLMIGLVTAPPSGVAASARPGGLFAALSPQEKDPPIPVVFRESPGPARQNPRPSDLSDADRRAGGGDPARGKSQTPFFAPMPGIEGLSPGPRGGQSRAPAAAAPPFPGASPSREASAGAEEEKRAAVFGPPPASESTSPVAPGREPRGGESSGPLSSLDRAIREAARDTAGGKGQEGAGFPNPDGGYVDSGPLSFDTTWYDWGPYAAEMVRRIKLHWEIPELARLGWKGKLTIRFFILADGQVADATIIRRSGVPPFDFAALQAIVKSSPFRPLPRDLGSSREGVTVTFYYNIRPERGGESEGTR